MILRERRAAAESASSGAPGRHMLKVDGETRMVNVTAGQQTEVGQCP